MIDIHPAFQALSIRYPIFQAPGSTAGPELAITVSSAGGVGSMSPYRASPEIAVAQVHQVLAATKNPFQINYVLITPPQSLIKVLDAGAPIITFSWGDPAPYISTVKSFGAAAGVQVTNVLGAKRARDLGADFLICQGIEAGGHVQSSTPLWDILPHIVAIAGDLPVIAAGGIGNGAGIAKALKAGAAGAMLGTRFVATQESRAHIIHKQRIVDSSSSDTALTVCFDRGWPQAMHRVIRNDTLENWEAAGSPISGKRPGEDDILGHSDTGLPILRYSDTVPRSTTSGHILDMALYTGTSCDYIHDIPGAAELVVRLWEECMTEYDH